MQLRIWHVINVPRERFFFNVPDTKTAKAFLKALADYDLFLGDGTDKPWTTVGGRLTKRISLAKATGNFKVAHGMFQAYDAYQLKHCPGGVPLVESNAQGCESFEAGDEGQPDEWVEFYDEEGNDIHSL